MLRTMQSLRLRKIPRCPSSLHRSLHTSTRLLRPSSGGPTKPHSADSYFKDVDETPPQDPTIHRVDAASDVAQSSYEPPSGQWSQAGVGTSEYEHVSKDVPYDVNGQAKETKLRYGGTERLDPEASRPEEGPEGQAREGRKPERSP